MLLVNHKNGNKTDNRLENLEWVSIEEFLRKNGLSTAKIYVRPIELDTIEITIEDKRYYISQDEENPEMFLSDIIDEVLNMGKINVKTFSTPDFPLIVELELDGYTEQFLEEDKFSDEYLDWCIESFKKDYNKFQSKEEIRVNYRTTNEYEACLSCGQRFVEKFGGQFNIHITKPEAYDGKLVYDLEFILEYLPEDFDIAMEFLDLIQYKYDEDDIDVMFNGQYTTIDKIIIGEDLDKKRRPSYPIWFEDGKRCI